MRTVFFIVLLVMAGGISSRVEAQILQCPLAVGGTSSLGPITMCRNGGGVTCGVGVATGFPTSISDTVSVRRTVASDIVTYTFSNNASSVGSANVRFTTVAADIDSVFDADLVVATGVSGASVHTVTAGDADANARYTFAASLNPAASNLGRFGSYTVTCQAVGARPTISPTSLPNSTVTASYSQTLTATNGPSPFSFAVTSGSLPTGLSLASGGALTGSPTIAGTYNFTVTVTAANGLIGTQSYTVVIAAAPTITTASPLPAGTGGVAYSQTFATSGGTAPVTITFDSGTLPPGITFSGGTISGTPTAAGTSNFVLRVTDSLGVTSTKSFSLTINPPTITLAPASLPNGTGGTPYSQTITASGGTAAYSFGVTAGSLPPGLTLAAGGDLTGTPTAAGTFTFDVTATDANGFTGVKPYTLIIDAPVITLAPASLPNGTGGTPYSQTITASGGTAAYSFGVTAGSLPPGLSLASGGALTGTPTAAGPFTFDVTATDNLGFTGVKPYTLSIDAPVITLAPGSLPNGTGSTPYSQTITASGGTAPYTFGVTAGSLPPGLALAAGGALTGTPTAVGTYPFQVTATDNFGFTGTQNYSVTIAAPTIVVSPGALPSGPQGQSVSQTLSGSGGLGPYTFAVTAGTLPPGLSLAPSGALTGSLTTPGTFAFTVTGTDANGFTGTRSYTITVGATVATTQQAIGSFMTRRAEAITSFDPFQARGRQRLMGHSAGGGGAVAAGPVGFTANDSGTRLAFSTSLSHALRASAANRDARMALGAGDGGSHASAMPSAPGLDIWIEGQYTRFDTDTAGAETEGHVGFIAIGADYLINPGFLIGAFVQVDDAAENSSVLGTRVDGTGWMAGPYVDLRFSENLYFHAHGGWGTSDNSVNPLGTYTDDFETERWMARATLTGDWAYDRWRFRPQLSLAHFEEEQKSYVDSLGNFIPSQTLILTRLSAGPEVAYRIESSDGSFIEPFVSVMGQFDLESSGVATFAGTATGGEGARLRLEAGVSGGSDELSFHATGFYEGFGDDDYRGVGGELSVRLPLN